MWEQLQVAKADPRAEHWAKELDVSPFQVQLLLNRGLDSVPACQAFLNAKPEVTWPDPPFGAELRQLFKQLHQQQALITIHGDYDVDGLTGTTVLYTFLQACGFRVQPYLPTRSEGYGLNLKTIDKLAAQGTQLLITVDCGISNHTEIEHATALGITTIITDHHGMPEEIPPARFVLHPQVLKIPELMNLAGVGVAYWLVTLLYDTFAPASAPALDSWLELVAMGTLADMTALQGLNRDVVKLGLQQLQRTTRPGLLALCELRKLNPAALTEQELNFQIIPALNAAGRVETPELALKLLLADSPAEAQERAEELQHLNQIRQQWCQEVLDDALKRWQQNPDQMPIVMASPEWPHGVLGIVCAQLVELRQRPVFLLALEDGIGKASVRAPINFHVLEALTAMKHHLIKFGGHAQAGGFSIQADHLPAFQRDLEAYARENASAPLPPVRVEAEVNPAQLSLELYHQIRQLAPFGMGNPEPVLLSLNAPLSNIRPDRSQKHLFANLGHPDIEVKAWKQWHPKWLTVERADLLYTLGQNTWRNKTSLSLQIKTLRSKDAKAQPLTIKVTPQAPPKPKAPALDLPGALYDPATQLAYAWPTQLAKAQPPMVQDHRHWLDSAQAMQSLLTEFGSTLLWWDSDWRGPVQPCPTKSPWQHLILTTFPAQPQLLLQMASALGLRTWHLLPASPLPLSAFDFDDLLALGDYLQALPLAQLPAVERLATQMAVPLLQMQAQLETLQQLGILKMKESPFRLDFGDKCYNLNDSPAFIHYQQNLRQREQKQVTWNQKSLEKIKEQLE